LIAASTDKYNNAKSRLEKSMVVHSIVEEVKKVKGRFLKQDRYSGRWYELDERQAKEKVGHAIRDATSSIDPNKKKAPLKKIRTDTVNPPLSKSISNDKMVLRTVSSDYTVTSTNPKNAHVHSSTPTKIKTAATFSSSSNSWDDMEPLNVDSLEAQNSFAALRKNDFFLKTVLGYSASSNALTSSSDHGENAPMRIGCV
jgi:hypothetical protein